MKPMRWGVVLLLVSVLWGGLAYADTGCMVTLPGSSTALPDSDCDGVPDKGDSCPKPDQKDANGAALDTDDDGVQDACDNCPKVANPKQWSPKCSTVSQQCQLDGDNDGVGDACDNCPKVPNPEQTDSNKDGIGDACGCAPEEEANAMTGGPKDTCQSETLLKEYSCLKGQTLSIPPVDCTIYGGAGYCGQDKNGWAVCVYKKSPEPPEEPTCGSKDSDADGVGDKCDNCPFKPNLDQKDSDGDDIGDACDPKECKVVSKPKEPPKCKEKNPFSHSDIALASATTMNLFAVTRISAGASTIDIIAGEGGNVLWRNSAKPVWAKFHNPWDDVPQIKIAATANYKRDITALWSSGSTMIATTVGGYVFQTVVDPKNPSNAVWQVVGANGVGDTTPLGSALYAVHGLSPSDFFVAGRKGGIWHYMDGGWQTPEQENFLRLLPWIWRMDLARRGDPNIPSRPNTLDFNTFASTTWRGIQAVSDGSVWVVGDGGRVVHKLSNGNWVDASFAEKTNLRAVWADTKELYIAGAAGKIFCNPQSIAQCAQLDSTSTVLGFSGDSGTALVAVGTKGVVAVKTGSDPKVWTPQVLPVPNSLTAVAGSATGSIIVGVNGSVYDLGPKGIVSDILLRKDLTHSEWTDTQWSAMVGTINKSGNIEGALFLAGDDLAVVNMDSKSWKWELLYSDDEFVPFTTFYSTSHRTIRDMTRVGNEFVAVGNFDFFVKGDLVKPWQRIPYGAQQNLGGGLQPFQNYKPTAVDVNMVLGATAPKSPDMKTARLGPAKTVLMAGNLGVFQYDSVTSAVTLLQSVSHAGAAAMTFKGNAIWALADGLGGGVTSVWSGIPKIVPEDVASYHDTIGVIGQEVASGNDFNFLGKLLGSVPMPWHFLKYQDGKWTDASALLPPATGLRRLKGFDATLYINPKTPTQLHGVAILGDHELVEISTGGGVLQLGYKPNSSDTWWDGGYNYDSYPLDFGLDGISPVVKAAFHVDVVGVGSHNRIQKFMLKYQCTISLKDLMKNNEDEGDTECFDIELKP